MYTCMYTPSHTHTHTHPPTHPGLRVAGDAVDGVLGEAHESVEGVGGGGGERGNGAPCAVCGGGGIGRMCGWCRVRGRAAEGGGGRGSRVLEELARFNTTFLLPVPVFQTTGMGGVGGVGGCSEAGSGVGSLSLALCDEVAVELVVSESGNLTRVGQLGDGFVNSHKSSLFCF
jgi:hypothetical protein